MKQLLLLSEVSGMGWLGRQVWGLVRSGAELRWECQSAGEVAVWQWEGAKLPVSSHRAQWLQATLTVSL